MAGSESDVAAFVAAAREFCGWVENAPGDDETERFTALVLLSALHARALKLPEIGSEALEHVVPRQHEPDGKYQKAIERLRAFPTPTYWRLEGCGEDGGEKVEDDLGRDLYLTYSAVRRSLDDFDSGPEQRPAAIWSWSYTFWGDWGRHSTNAVQVLQQHFYDKAWSDE